MKADLLKRLPNSREVTREIYATARRGRQLRSLYKVIRRIERENAEADAKPAATDSDAATASEVAQ